MLYNIYSLLGLIFLVVGILGVSVDFGSRVYKLSQDKYSDWENYVNAGFIAFGFIFLVFVAAFLWPLGIPVIIGVFLAKKDAEKRKKEQEAVKLEEAARRKVNSPYSGVY